jgi:chemotaxis methyl-accepting protein methylase
VDWAYLRQLVLERSGIAMADDKRPLVEARLAELWRELGLRSCAALVEKLRREPAGTLADQARGVCFRPR